MTKLVKSKKEYRWYRMIGYKGLEWALFNFFILYKKNHPDKKGKRKYALLRYCDHAVDWFL